MNRIRRGAIPIILLYSLISIILTFPFILKFGSEIPGDVTHIDQTVRLWQMWWMNFSVRNGLPILTTDYLFYPFGIDLLAFFGGYFDLLYFIPFTFIFSPILTNNNLLFLALVFAGFSGYILTKEITGDRLAGLAGGTMALVNPYIYLHSMMSHTEQVEIGALLLSIYFFHRTLKKGSRKRDIFLTALFVLMTYLCYMAYAIFGLLYFALFSLIHPIFEPSKVMLKLYSHHLRNLLITLLLSILFILPLILLFLKSYLTFDYGSNFLLPETISVKRENLPWNVRGGSPFIYLEDRDFEWRTIQSSVTLPELLEMKHLLFLILPLALTILAINKAGAKERGLYLTILIICGLNLIFSLGPYLRLDSSLESSSIPLPYLILHKFIPFFARFHHPERFLSLFYGLLSVLAGGGAGVLGRWAKERGSRYLLYALIFVHLMVFKVLYPPFESSPLLPCPEFYERIKGEGDIKIIDLPFSFSKRQISIFPLYYQFCHEKKILEGIPHFYNLRNEYRDFISSNHLLGTLLLICNGEYMVDEEMRRNDFKEDIQNLVDTGFRYIILHTRGEEQQMFRNIETFLTHILGEPAERVEGEIIVWEMR